MQKRQYQGPNKVHRFDKEGDKAIRKPELKNYQELDLVYNNKFSFYKHHDIKKFKSNSIESKYSDLDEFHRDLDKFNSLDPRKNTQKRKKIE